MVNLIESQQDSNTPTSARALRLAQEGKNSPLTESNRNLLRYYGYKITPDKITTTYNDDDLTRIEVMDDRVNDPVLLNELFGFQKSYSSHTVAQPIIPLTIDKTNDDDLDSSDATPETSSSGAMVDESESITVASNAAHRSSEDSENLLDICHVRLIPRDSIQVDRNKSHALDDFDLTCGAPVIGDIPLVTYTSDYATGTVIDESSVGGLGKDLDSPLNKINLSSASSMNEMAPAVSSDPTEVKPDSNVSNDASNNVNGRSESESNLKIRWVIPEAVESKKASRNSMPCWSDVIRSGWWTLSTDNWTSPYIMVDIDSSDAINRYKNAVDEGLPPASYVILNQANGHAQFFWLIPPSRRYDDKGHKTDTLGLYELITSTLNWKLDGDVNAHGHRCRNPYYSGCNSSSRLGYSMNGGLASDAIAPAVTIGFYDGNADPAASDLSDVTDAAGSSPDLNLNGFDGDGGASPTALGLGSTDDDDEIRVSVFYPGAESDGGIHVWSLSELYYELSALDWINEGRRVINTRKALARRNGVGSLFDGSWSALDPQFIDGEIPAGYRLNATFRVLTWGAWTGHVEPELDAMLQFVRQTLVFDESGSPFTDDEIKSACRSVLKFYRAHFNPNHPSRLNDRLTALGEGYGEDVEDLEGSTSEKLSDDEIITRGLMRLGLKIDGSDAESVIDVLTNKPVCSKDDLVIDREQRRLLDPRARLSGSRGGSRQSLAQRMAQVDNLAKGRGRKVGEDGLTDSERLVLKAISEVRAGEVSGSLKGNESSRDDASRLDGILDSMGREESVINPNLKNASDSMNDDQDWTFLLRRTPSTSDGGSGEAEDFVVDSDGKPTVDDDPAAGWLAMMAEPVDEERTKVFAFLQHSYDSKMAKSTFYALYRRVVNAAKWRLIREVWKVIKRSFNLWEKKEWSPDNDYWSRPLFWMGKISFAVANQLAPQLARAGYVRSALSCLDAVKSVVRFVDHKMEDESLWVLEPILTVMKHVYIDNGLVHVSGLEEEEDIILPPDLDCSSSGDAVAWMGHGDGRRSRRVDRDDLGSMGVLADYVEWASVGLYELMGKVWITRDTYRGHVLDGVCGFQDVIQTLDESSLSLKAVREKSTGGGRAPDEVGMILTGW